MELFKEKIEDELNYKQAYYYLFNQVTSLIDYLKSVQQKCEEICIELPSQNITEADVLKAMMQDRH